MISDVMLDALEDIEKHYRKDAEESESVQVVLTFMYALAMLRNLHGDWGEPWIRPFADKIAEATGIAQDLRTLINSLGAASARERAAHPQGLPKVTALRAIN